MEAGYIVVLCASLLAFDGDTVSCDGVSMRLLGDGAPYKTGIDAPETIRARCKKERLLGERAQARLAELIVAGATVEDSGARDPFQRPLVKLRLPDGRTAGAVLISEGLATVWTGPSYKAAWCD